MSGVATTYERTAARLLAAALEVAMRELGGDPTDWQVTFEGPAQVVVKAGRGERFGTFAAIFEDGAIRGESYGTRWRDPEDYLEQPARARFSRS